jgi:hypothetical protein
VWVDVTLATDDDLAALEPDMPGDARRVVGDSGLSAYDGKRGVAKERIEDWIRGRGFDPDGLTRPAQLKTPAVMLELSLIYQAMATRNESVYIDKAAVYQAQFADWMRNISLEYEEPSTSTAEAGTRMPIRMVRS